MKQILIFGHDKCAPCKTLISKLNKYQVSFKYVDLTDDENLPLIKMYDINNAPTLIFLENNCPKDSIIGCPSDKELLEFLKSHGLIKQI